MACSSRQLFTCHADKGDRNWVGNNYLSEYALTEAENVRHHLEGIMERYEVALLSTTDERKRDIRVRIALCCGFFMQVAHKEGKGHYHTVKDNQVCCTSFSHSPDSRLTGLGGSRLLLCTRLAVYIDSQNG